MHLADRPIDPPAAIISTQARAKQQLMLMLKVLISRAYRDGGGVGRIVSMTVGSGGDRINGTFEAQRKSFDFTLDLGKGMLGYKAQVRSRGDRMDARRRARKPDCIKGISCGDTCIPSNKTCRIKLSQLAQSKELNRIKDVAVQASAPPPPAAIVKAATNTPLAQSAADEDLEGRTIRELQAIARKEGVYRANHLNKQELKRAIKVARGADADYYGRHRETPKAPPVEDDGRRSGKESESIRKTLERKEKDAGIGGIDKDLKQTIGITLDVFAPQLGMLWRRIDRLRKMAGTNPALATIASGALVVGVGIGAYQGLQQKSDKSLKNEAKLAEQNIQARIDEIGYVRKGSIVMAVGGSGSPSQAIIDALPDEMKRGDKSSEIIAFDDSAASITLPDGVDPDSSAGLFHVLQRGFGTNVANNLGSALNPLEKNMENSDAVRMAKEIYAQASRVHAQGGKEFQLPITIVAHGTGGLTARRAMAIVGRMKGGDKVLSRVELITLGTPSYGLISDPERETNIMGSDDPMGFPGGIGRGMTTTVDGVGGHSARRYLNHPRIREQLLERYKNTRSLKNEVETPAGREKRRKRDRERALAEVQRVEQEKREARKQIRKEILRENHPNDPRNKIPDFNPKNAVHKAALVRWLQKRVTERMQFEEIEEILEELT